MTNVAYTLMAFFITGVCISIIFDIFRISRKEFKTPNIVIYMEDILFWFISGAGILYTFFNFTDRWNKIVYDICNGIRFVYIFY